MQVGGGGGGGGGEPRDATGRVIVTAGERTFLLSLTSSSFSMIRFFSLLYFCRWLFTWLSSSLSTPISFRDA